MSSLFAPGQPGEAVIPSLTQQSRNSIATQCGTKRQKISLLVNVGHRRLRKKLYRHYTFGLPQSAGRVESSAV